MWEDIKAILEDDQGIDWSEGEPVLLPHEQLRGLLADAEALLPALHELMEKGIYEEWQTAWMDGRTVRTFEEWLEAFYPVTATLPARLREQGEG